MKNIREHLKTQNALAKGIMINEDRESKAQSKFRKAIGQYFTKDLVQQIYNKFRDYIPAVRLPFYDIVNQKGTYKFAPGMVRIYFDLQGITSEDIDFTGEDMTKLNELVEYIAENCPDDYNENLNNRSLEELERAHRRDIVERQKAIRAASKEKGDHIKNSRYTIVPIKEQEECRKYRKYTSWCITYDTPVHYNGYIHGTGKFYICLRDDYQSIDKHAGENAPLDDYGFSMIAISVDKEGNLNTCTTRWNHEIRWGGSDDKALTVPEIEELLGVDFFDTFLPRTKDEMPTYDNPQEYWEEVVIPGHLGEDVYFDDEYLNIHEFKYENENDPDYDGVTFIVASDNDGKPCVGLNDDNFMFDADLCNRFAYGDSAKRVRTVYYNDDDMEDVEALIWWVDNEDRYVLISEDGVIATFDSWETDDIERFVSYFDSYGSKLIYRLMTKDGKERLYIPGIDRHSSSRNKLSEKFEPDSENYFLCEDGGILVIGESGNGFVWDNLGGRSFIRGLKYDAFRYYALGDEYFNKNNGVDCNIGFLLRDGKWELYALENEEFICRLNKEYLSDECFELIEELSYSYIQMTLIPTSKDEYDRMFPYDLKYDTGFYPFLEDDTENETEWEYIKKWATNKLGKEFNQQDKVSLRDLNPDKIVWDPDEEQIRIYWSIEDDVDGMSATNILGTIEFDRIVDYEDMKMSIYRDEP